MCRTNIHFIKVEYQLVPRASQNRDTDYLQPGTSPTSYKDQKMPTTKNNPSPQNSTDRKYNFILDEVTEKIMRVLLENPKIPYTKSSLAEVSNVSRDALYRRWDKLQELGIIEEAPTGGKQSHYRLNTDSEIANQIGKLLYTE